MVFALAGDSTTTSFMMVWLSSYARVHVRGWIAGRRAVKGLMILVGAAKQRRYQPASDDARRASADAEATICSAISPAEEAAVASRPIIIAARSAHCTAWAL